MDKNIVSPFFLTHGVDASGVWKAVYSKIQAYISWIRIHDIMISFSSAMLRRARYCHRIGSVCLSVCDALQAPLPCSHRLEFFKNNFTAE